MVRLEGESRDRGFFDHVACIGARERVVWDCIERLAMRFTARTLDACVGDGVEIMGVTELRCLELQTEREQLKNKRKNSPYKRK